MTSQSRWTKTLYVNGVIVGEVEASGDAEEDIRRMREFLVARGLSRDVSAAQAAFGQALSFATTAAYLHKRDLLVAPRNGLSVVPFVVNAAFSIELYLKTLHIVEGREERGHLLVALYDGLSDLMRASLIASALANAESYGVQVQSADDFRGFIAELNSAFVDWRYSHEGGETGSIRIQPMILVMKALDDVCRRHLSVSSG